MIGCCILTCVFFFNDTATTEIYTLSLHDALPISLEVPLLGRAEPRDRGVGQLAEHGLQGPDGPYVVAPLDRSEEHTSELQSRQYLVCRLLLEKKKILHITHPHSLISS